MTRLKTELNQTEALKSVHGPVWTFLNVLKSKGPIYCQRFMHEYVINNTHFNFNRQSPSALNVQLHFGADVDYFEKLSHYSFGAGVVKLNKEIKETEHFENAVFN